MATGTYLQGLLVLPVFALFGCAGYCGGEFWNAVYVTCFYGEDYDWLALFKNVVMLLVSLCIIVGMFRGHDSEEFRPEPGFTFSKFLFVCAIPCAAYLALTWLLVPLLLWFAACLLHPLYSLLVHRKCWCPLGRDDLCCLLFYVPFLSSGISIYLFTIECVESVTVFNCTFHDIAGTQSSPGSPLHAKLNNHCFREWKIERRAIIQLLHGTIPTGLSTTHKVFLGSALFAGATCVVSLITVGWSFLGPGRTRLKNSTLLAFSHIFLLCHFFAAILMFWFLFGVLCVLCCVKQSCRTRIVLVISYGLFWLFLSLYFPLQDHIIFKVFFWIFMAYYLFVPFPLSTGQWLKKIGYWDVGPLPQSTTQKNGLQATLVESGLSVVAQPWLDPHQGDSEELPTVHARGPKVTV